MGKNSSFARQKSSRSVVKSSAEEFAINLEKFLKKKLPLGIVAAEVLGPPRAKSQWKAIWYQPPCG